jgi:hypothetical protein
MMDHRRIIGPGNGAKVIAVLSWPEYMAMRGKPSCDEM